MCIYSFFLLFKGIPLDFDFFPLLKGIPLDLGFFSLLKGKGIPLKSQKRIQFLRGIPFKNGKKTQIPLDRVPSDPSGPVPGHSRVPARGPRICIYLRIYTMVYIYIYIHHLVSHISIYFCYMHYAFLTIFGHEALLRQLQVSLQLLLFGLSLL